MDIKESITQINDVIIDLQDAVYNLEMVVGNYEKTNPMIKDLDNFVTQCKIRNLWSNELDEFLEQYLRFFND